MPEFVHILNTVNFLPKIIFLLLVSQLTPVDGFVILIQKSKTGDRLIQIIVLKPSQVRLLVYHFIKKGLIFARYVYDQQKKQDQAQKQRIDRVYQCLVVILLKVDKISTAEDERKDAEEDKSCGEPVSSKEKISAIDEKCTEVVPAEKSRVDHPKERQGQSTKNRNNPIAIQIILISLLPMIKSGIINKIPLDPHVKHDPQYQTAKYSH